MLSPASKPGIEAFVRRVDGQRFNEYEIVQRKDLGSKPPTTCAYLESEENVEFEVGLVFHDKVLARYRDHDWIYTVSVDGRRIHKHVYMHDDPGCCVKEMKFIKDGQNKRGNLCFTALPTTDDQSRVTLRGSDLVEIGNIQIDMFRGVKQGYTSHASASGGTYLPTHELGIADEKDKKWSAAIGVGDVRNDDASQSFRSVKWKSIDKDKPYHRFTFMYRTRAVLELIKVVGRAKSLLSGMSTSGSKKKPEIICIDDSDDEDPTVIEIRARDTPIPKAAPVGRPAPETLSATKRKRQLSEESEAGRDARRLLKPMSQMSLSHTLRA